MSDAFAQVLRKQRETKHETQELFAQKAGLHITYIGMVERLLRDPALNTA